MYRFRLDEDRGVLVAYVIGRWTVAEVQHFVPNLFKHAEIARQRCGRLCVLMDAREAVEPDPKLMSGFEEVMGELIQSPEDRFASVVASNILKLRVRQNIGSPKFAVFLSESAAMTWLSSQKPHACVSIRAER